MMYNNDDLKEFAINLAQKLEVINAKLYAGYLKEWSKESFTTSSEFLGELKLILERVNNLKALDIATKKDVRDCLKEIEQAFST